MNYYSTTAPDIRQTSLTEAVVHGMAPDSGLYLPERIPVIPSALFRHISAMPLPDVAYVVTNVLMGDDIPSETLKEIVSNTLTFPIPLEPTSPGIYGLELWHGPTGTFKDVSARFMARLLGHLAKSHPRTGSPLTVLTASSGGSGSAMASGFHGIDGVRIVVVFPRGKVSQLQQAQFASLGGNVSAVEIDGTIDECKKMVHAAFADEELNRKMSLTSGNSINIARLLPQMFYYFHAYARLRQLRPDTVKEEGITVSVPCGNLGNLCAAIIARAMGLPINKIVAACNANTSFADYLNGHGYTPRPTVDTIAPAIDVGSHANFPRIERLYEADRAGGHRYIHGVSLSDAEITEAMRKAYSESGKLLCPQSATAYGALLHTLEPGQCGIYLATGHPAKFSDAVRHATSQTPELTPAMRKLLERERHITHLPAQYPALRKFLLNL